MKQGNLPRTRYGPRSSRYLGYCYSSHSDLELAAPLGSERRARRDGSRDDRLCDRSRRLAGLAICPPKQSDDIEGLLAPVVRRWGCGPWPCFAGPRCRRGDPSEATSAPRQIIGQIEHLLPIGGGDGRGRRTLSSRAVQRRIGRAACEQAQDNHDRTDPSVLSPNCLHLCLTVGKAIRRREDTSKKLILVWFSLANAMMTTTAKGDGICETPHQTSIP